MMWAVVTGVLGVLVACHHPLSPALFPAAFVLASLAFFLFPNVWPLAIPALLPIANGAPWTGWIAFEEFDLLVLAAATGGSARLALCPPPRVSFSPRDDLPPHRYASVVGACAGRLARWSCRCMAACWVFSLLHGAWAAGAIPEHWFEGYLEPLNTLRVGKSLLLVLVLDPLLRRQLRTGAAAFAWRLATGVTLGLALTSLTIGWERHLYPGFLDFSTPYRATAQFWEMHIGGAAVDGFLILALPFAVWALRSAASVRSWWLAAGFSLLAVYACLTTFSRVVYGGAIVAMVVLAACLKFRCPVSSPGAQGSPQRGEVLPPADRWRVRSNRFLLFLVVLEIVVVVGLGDFMRHRLSTSENDLAGRLQHWRDALSVLRDPVEVLFGRGLGRFPAAFATIAAGQGAAGRLRLVNDRLDGTYLSYQGAEGGERQRGIELLQRVSVTGDRLLVAMDLRTNHETILDIGICRRHLLYDASCVLSELVVAKSGQLWRPVALPLAGPALHGSWWQSPPAFFVLHFKGDTQAIDLDNVSVRAGTGVDLIENGQFGNGMAHWFFSSDHYFVPWHIDNVWLEVLIEQGVIGLLAFLALMFSAWVNLLVGPGREHWLAPYLMGALTASLAIGFFVSLLDMPRTVFLFFLLAVVAMHLDGRADLKGSGKGARSGWRTL